MSTRNKTTDFLAALADGANAAPAAAPKSSRRQTAPPKAARAKPAATATPAAKPDAPAERHHSRVDRKHFGGYLDPDTLEIAAVLRVRLKMDNSELIKFALEELDRTHKAKRAFGDA